MKASFSQLLVTHRASDVSQYPVRIPILTLVNRSATLKVNHLERQEIFRL
jgi:hypothetical protein